MRYVADLVMLCAVDTCNCGLEYAPVCANDTQTYGNACIAKCINQAVVSQGSCVPCSNTAKGSKQLNSLSVCMQLANIMPTLYGF